MISILFAAPLAAQQNAPVEPLVTVTIKDRPLPEALAIIEARVPIRFAYPTDLMHDQKPVSISVTDMPLHDFLAQLFRQTTLTYRLIGNQVVLDGPRQPPKITISGYVRDARNGESLIGASVYIPASRLGVLTNSYGFYSLTLPSVAGTADAGTTQGTGVEISYVGYKPLIRYIAANRDSALSFGLDVDHEQIDSLTYTDDKRADFVKKNPSARLDLASDMLTMAPSVNGNGDLLGSVEMLPGVQAGIDGTPGFFVRGGNAGQNLIVLDEATLYNPSHIFGLVSVFNPAAVKQASLMKEGFPAAYGDHVSSVLDVTMKDGDNRQTGGTVELGTVSSGATLYGPLQTGKSSFLVSGRRSTTDVLLHPFLKNNYFSNYYFYDVNAKLNFELSSKDRLLLSFYSGRDNNNFSSDSSSGKDTTGIGYSMHFGNAAVTARWNHQFSGKVFSNTSIEYNKYNQFLSATQAGYFAQLYSGIRDLDARTNLTWYLTPEHKINAGADYLFQTLSPASLSGKIDSPGSPQNIIPSGIPSRSAGRFALYASDEWKPGNRWQIYAGLRAPLYSMPDARYFSLEPRLSLLYLIDDATSIKVSFAAMHQYIHLVQSYNATFPAEIWIGSSSLVHPQVSREISAGLFRNFAGNSIQTSFELYYKRLGNQLLFGGDSTGSINTDIENQLIFGKGWDYGAEFFVRKNRGRWTGWLSYTLAYAWLQFDSLNEGVSFPFAYDRRQMLDLSLAYDLSPHWKLAANFLLASGRAFSLSPDSTYVPGSNPLFTNPGRGLGRDNGNGNGNGTGTGNGTGNGNGNGGGRTNNPNVGSWNVIQNNYRLSPYNRLDLSVHYTRTRTTARRTTRTEWIFSVYNVYARPNNSLVYRTIDPTTGQVVARQLPLIPVIPSITFSYGF